MGKVTRTPLYLTSGIFNCVNFQVFTLIEIIKILEICLYVKVNLGSSFHSCKETTQQEQSSQVHISEESSGTLPVAESTQIVSETPSKSQDESQTLFEDNSGKLKIMKMHVYQLFRKYEAFVLKLLKKKPHILAGPVRLSIIDFRSFDRRYEKHIGS